MRGTVDGKRVYLSPVSEWEMQKQLDAGEKRYEEILKACRKDPDRWYWYTDWTVHSKLIGCPVGTIRFGGPAAGRCPVAYLRDQGAVPPSGLRRGGRAGGAAVGEPPRRHVFHPRTGGGRRGRGARAQAAVQVPARQGGRLDHGAPRAKWLAGYLLVGLMIGLMIGQLMKAATQGTIIGAGVGLVLGVVLFLRDAKLRRGVRERLLAENRE